MPHKRRRRGRKIREKRARIAAKLRRPRIISDQTGIFVSGEYIKKLRATTIFHKILENKVIEVKPPADDIYYLETVLNSPQLERDFDFCSLIEEATENIIPAEVPELDAHTAAVESELNSSFCVNNNVRSAEDHIEFSETSNIIISALCELIDT
ncbi:PREDICTED: uncharacterized protein LOC106742904 [Dinoponera quadriceps]|uniref:Uncharacterized protein LOC106742904 n=1 Tax=Dinoponera quadriceps TaxID=609295 RepID=A0A6P3X088_DINQU|nr:PREDICTED: uncharacterized protein LOC106742904 [Dinoponera quadriceps]